MSEKGRVMIMRRTQTPVNRREQGPGPVGSARKEIGLVVRIYVELVKAIRLTPE
jgi:hypothetical protein